MNSFGERLQEIRKRSGLSQNGLSAMLGWGKNRISNYEQNVRTPSIEDCIEMGTIIERKLKEKGALYYLLTGTTIDEYVSSETFTVNIEKQAILDLVFDSLKILIDMQVVHFEEPFTLEKVINFIDKKINDSAVFSAPSVKVNQ